MSSSASTWTARGPAPSARPLCTPRAQTSAPRQTPRAAASRSRAGLSMLSPAVVVAAKWGCNSTERVCEPDCELYGRVFRTTVQRHCMGARKAAEQPRIAPRFSPKWAHVRLGVGKWSSTHGIALYGRARGPAVAHPTGPIGPTPRGPSIVPRGRSVLGTRSGLFPRVGPTGS